MAQAGHRRLVAAAISALGLLAGTAACTNPPSPQDLAVAVTGGEFGPVGWGNVSWKAVGTDAVTGPTTLTLTVMSGPLVFGGGEYSEPDPGYRNTGYTLSDDHRTITMTFDGSTAVDRTRFFKFQYGGLSAPGQAGTLRATVANANDTDPANDVATSDYVAVGPFVTAPTS
jgi:hypothetical protein